MTGHEGWHRVILDNACYSTDAVEAQSDAVMKKTLMRISELSRSTGVSLQTIHYYVREGLLPPPTKTAPNMAYYGPEYVEDVRLIKELQEKRFLPLSVIKLVLEAKRKGKDATQLQEMRLALENVFHPLGPEEELEPVGLVEFVALTGLSMRNAEVLQEMGLLMPVESEQAKRYDGLDVRAARAIKTLLDLGLRPRDLSFYSKYLEVLRTEASVIGERVIRLKKGTSPIAGNSAKQALDDLKAALAAKIYRQAALDLNKKAG